MTLDHTIRRAYIDTLLDGGFTRLADKTINPTEGYIVGGVTEPTTMANPITELALTDVNAHFEGFKKLWNQYELQLDDYIQNAADQSAELMWGYAIDENLTEDVCFPSGLGVGTWIHEGQIYFDIVQHIYSLDVATKLAKERNEIAVYDCANQKDILL
jgi:hypothetical protein|tara:strand:+ start:46796 stop:47269 length:474 start_codon:yes stop_codon:yes gene_type:complete